MKIAMTLAAVAGLVVPASPALAAPSDVPAPALVARWDFNAAPVAGKIADTSGRAPALAVRAADQGVVRFDGQYVTFPAACVAGATTCPRGLLEAADDAEIESDVGSPLSSSLLSGLVEHEIN